MCEWAKISMGCHLMQGEPNFQVGQAHCLFWTIVFKLNWVQLHYQFQNIFVVGFLTNFDFGEQKNHCFGMYFMSFRMPKLGQKTLKWLKWPTRNKTLPNIKNNKLF